MQAFDTRVAAGNTFWAVCRHTAGPNSLFDDFLGPCLVGNVTARRKTPDIVQNYNHGALLHKGHPARFDGAAVAPPPQQAR